MKEQEKDNDRCIHVRDNIKEMRRLREAFFYHTSHDYEFNAVKLFMFEVGLVPKLKVGFGTMYSDFEIVFFCDTAR